MNPMVYLFLALTGVLAVTSNDAVLDSDGHIIFGGNYYVLPAIHGQGGGLVLDSRGARQCPADVVQSSSEGDLGLPVKFSNWRAKVAFVPESMNLNIETKGAATICVQGTYWWVDEFDPWRMKYFVTTWLRPDMSGKDPLKSFFQIKKAGNDAYKFVFCPRNCTDVGIFDDNGVRRLALSPKPFLVQFKKANETKHSSKIMSIISM